MEKKRKNDASINYNTFFFRNFAIKIKTIHIIKVRMKSLFISLASLTLLIAAQAQTGKEWDNPQITSVNRETAHTLALPMTSEADIVKNDRTLSPYYQSLDGIWKFNWVNTIEDRKSVV